MAVLLTALGLFVHLRFSSQLTAAIDQGLRTRAGQVTALVRQGRSDLLGSTNEVLAEPDEGFAQVLNQRGRVVASTPGLGPGPVLGRPELGEALAGNLTIERAGVLALEGPARVLATPVRARGRQSVVVVGSSLEDRDEPLRDLAALLVAGGAAALLLASLAGYGMATAAMRPVEAMRRRAAAISADQPKERLPLPEADDELRRLGETLNSMLDRLEAAVERERTFVDDASHELRTPMALHKTELELALRHGGSAEELRASIASAIEESDRVIQLAEDLLVVARSDKGRLALELEPVTGAGLFEDVLSRFAIRTAGEDSSLVIAAEAEPITFEADRLRLEQALTNIVDNALRHGDGEVSLSARARGGRVELHVEDAGNGFPDGFVDSAFERFTRADTARSRGGTGLGLAIVAAIAEAHGGSAHAVNRDGGGADVWIELPREPGASP